MSNKSERAAGVAEAVAALVPRQQDCLADDAQGDEIIEKAMQVLEGRLRKAAGPAFKRPDDAAAFAKLRLATRKAEVFAVMLLDSRHRLIEYREMFFGTIDGATVYPREVLRAAMEVNAAAILLVHNHPSSNPRPSDADREITRKLQKALALVDIQVLDHIVVGGSEHTSLAETGWI